MPLPEVIDRDTRVFSRQERSHAGASQKVISQAGVQAAQAARPYLYPTTRTGVIASSDPTKSSPGRASVWIFHPERLL